MILPHTVTVLTAGVGADSRGDPAQTFTGSTARGWLQQTGQSEQAGDRDERSSSWTFYSTETPTLHSLDRIQWDGKTFVCDGQPNHLSTPRGYHHTEAQLLLVEG